MEHKKYQKNLNLSQRAVEVYLPALRRVFGTYTTAADVAFANLYHNVVSDVVGVTDELDATEHFVKEQADGQFTIESVVWRYDPRQDLTDLPCWMYLQVANQDDVEKAQAFLEGLGLMSGFDRDGFDYFVSFRTQGLLDAMALVEG